MYENDKIALDLANKFFNLNYDKNLQINKLTPNIGAEIIGNNVFENLSSKICDEIYKYLIEYKHSAPFKYFHLF